MSTNPHLWISSEPDGPPPWLGWLFAALLIFIVCMSAAIAFGAPASELPWATLAEAKLEPEAFVGAGVCKMPERCSSPSICRDPAEPKVLEVVVITAAKDGRAYSFFVAEGGPVLGVIWLTDAARAAGETPSRIGVGLLDKDGVFDIQFEAYDAVRHGNSPCRLLFGKGI